MDHYNWRSCSMFVDRNCSCNPATQNNMRARWYDTQSGVFTSVDPAVSSTNQPYQFANGDPVNNSDPRVECQRVVYEESRVTVFASTRVEVFLT
ncbi:MAG: RHS repeat-associated core domain-containing protein [Acidimicrobiales bacterium]